MGIIIIMAIITGFGIFLYNSKHPTRGWYGDPYVAGIVFTLVGGMMLAVLTLVSLVNNLDNSPNYQKCQVLSELIDASMCNQDITEEERILTLDRVMVLNNAIRISKFAHSPEMSFWIGAFHHRRVGEMTPFDIKSVPHVKFKSVKVGCDE